MELVKESTSSEEVKLLFASYLKTDYVKDSIIINYEKESSEVSSVYITELEMGNLTWNKDIQKYEIHKWENEDQAKDTSVLNKYFTQIMSNGLVSSTSYENIYFDRIIELILESEKLTVKYKLQLIKIIKQIKEQKNKIYLN